MIRVLIADDEPDVCLLLKLQLELLLCAAEAR